MNKDLNANKNTIVIDIIDIEMTTEDIVQICNKTSGCIPICTMDNLNNIMSNTPASEVIRLIQNSSFHFNLNEKYFSYIGNKCIISFNDPRNVDEIMRYDVLVEHLLYKESDSILNKYKNRFINEFCDNFLNQDTAKCFVNILSDFGHINIIKDDWNKLFAMIESLINNEYKIIN